MSKEIITTNAYTQRWLFVLLLFCMPISLLHAQQKVDGTDDSLTAITTINPHNYDVEVTDEYRRWRKEQALENIDKLHQGALLVRLKTRTKNIEAYKKVGAIAIAKRIEAEQRAQNKKIQRYFKENFDFCEVYFFYTKDTERVLKGDKVGYFLNKELYADPSIELTNDFFMIAELDALLEEDIYGNVTDMQKDKGAVIDKNLQAPIDRHENTSLTRVLVIKDASFEQLTHPFPFFVKASFDRFLPKKIKRLNKKLHRFYTSRSEQEID